MDDLRIDLTSGFTMNPANGTSSVMIHMQPYTRSASGREKWKKRGAGLVGDSVEELMRAAATLIEDGKIEMLLDPKAHAEAPA
jgi:hypothetical protein